VTVRRFLSLGVVLTMIGCSLLTDLSDLGTTTDAPIDSPIDASLDGAVEAGACKGTRGASQVVIDGKYCIDATEITIEQFQEFLTVVKGSFAPYLPDGGECNAVNPVPGDWGTQQNPYDGGPPLGAAAAGDLNWCSVYAYCAYAGKRMCGKIGGGKGDLANVNDAVQSEWFNVCSHGDDKLHTWSYGVTFDASTCRIDTSPPEAGLPVPPESYPNCVGGYPGVFDMSGNVAEWTNECALDDAGCAQQECCSVRTPGVGQSIGGYSECISSYQEARFVYVPFQFGGRCCSDVN
jgi:formylglycine-generating enzyme